MAIQSSCSKRETPVEEGIRTHTLLLGNQNEPATLDPHVVEAYTDQIVLVSIFEGLAVLDEKTSQALPGVAERWDVSPDGLTYTFHLRANALWSNGDPVTARDFAFSFQRLLTPAFGATYSYMLWPIKNAERFNKGELKDFSGVGAEVVDDHMLRIHLEHPTPYLPALTTHQTWFPVHRASIEKLGKIDDRGNPWTRPGKLVGNGAFVLTEWTPNARIVVTKNPRYWDAAHTWLERVIFFPTEKSGVEELNFRAGQMHVTHTLPTSKIATYRQQSPERLRIDPLLNTYYVNFNVTKPPLDNAKVRRALALAIDRPAISHTVYGDAMPPSLTLTAEDHSGYVPPQRSPHDFAAARALLAEAGYPGGRGLPAMSIQTINDDKSPKVCETIQAMWQRELGVRITIEPYEQKTWIQNQQTLSHTIALMAWTADYPDPITFLDIFRTGGGNNWTGWGDKAYDGLLDQAANTADAKARFQILQRAEALLLDTAPIAPFNHNASVYLLHPAVKNWDPAPLGLHRFQRVELQN